MSCVQLTSEERYVIYHLKLFKLSLREMHADWDATPPHHPQP